MLQGVNKIIIINRKLEAERLELKSRRRNSLPPLTS